MAVIPLVPETKMTDVGELINLENVLVRKITWFLLTTTSAPLILSRVFGADHMTRIAYIYSRLPRTHSLTLWLPETAYSLSLSLSHTQTHTNTHIWLPETAHTHSLSHFDLSQLMGFVTRFMNRAPYEIKVKINESRLLKFYQKNSTERKFNREFCIKKP